MKKVLYFFFLVVFVFGLASCSKDDSPTGPENQSDITGSWGINMEKYSGNSLIEKMDVYLTINEVSGALTGSGTVYYYVSGENSTEMNIENSVSGYYQPGQSPNIVVTVGAQAGTTPPFTFSGDWDTFGENFKGQVIIYSDNQIYTLTDNSFYKRSN